MLLDRLTQVLGATLTSSIGASVAQYSSAFTAKAPFEGRMITLQQKNVTYNTAGNFRWRRACRIERSRVSTFLSLIEILPTKKKAGIHGTMVQKSYDTPLSLGGGNLRVQHRGSYQSIHKGRFSLTLATGMQA